MNKYLQNGVDRQEQAKTTEEADRFFKSTCEGWYSYVRQQKIGGCHMQAVCDETKCPVWQAHQARVVYLESGVQNIPIQYVSKNDKKEAEVKKPVKKAESWYIRAKRAVIYYLDKETKNALKISTKMAIDIENVSVQIYSGTDIDKALSAIKNKYQGIYLEAINRKQKYIPAYEEAKNWLRTTTARKSQEPPCLYIDILF